MRYAGILVLLAWGVAGGRLDAVRAAGVTQEPNGTPQALTLPDKPAGLTQTFSVGAPQIHFSARLAKLYDAEALGSQIGSSLGNILNDSGRFVLTEDEHPQYRCVISVNDLEIEQKQATNRTGFAAVTGFLTSKLKGGSPGMLTNIDLSQTELNMSVKCTVAMQVFNGANRQLVAGGTGHFEETGTTKSVAVGVAGVSLLARPVPGSTAQTPTNSFDLQCRVVELAAFRAFTELLPTLDRRLLNAPKGAAAAAPVVQMKATEAAPALAAGEAVCPHCGKPVKIGDKFCSNCGQPLPLFCSNCGKPLKPGDKFCPNCGKAVVVK